jgi:molybdate transport system substrate-binding protein
MNNRRLILVSIVMVFCLLPGPAAAQIHAELHVLSSNLARPAISELIPMFEKIYEIKVNVQYANNPIVKQQIEAGAKFDVVIIEPKMLEELSVAAFVDRSSTVDLAKVGMALVSKEGAPAVDIGSLESFKKVLLSAKSVAYTADGHSGSVFLRTLEQMGLADHMKPKLVPVVGRFSTLAVAEGTAQYTAFPAVGFGPGVQVAGMFPKEVQTYIGVSAGVSSKAAAPGSARSFLDYLQSVSATALFKSQGFTPLVIEQVSVPIEKEPMHRLKFENEFVRLFDVFIPSGKTSQYHTHLYDGVSVRLSNAQIIDEVVAGEKTPIEIKYAEATFGSRPSPLTHRVINKGTSDFRNIFIEILPKKNSATGTALPILSDGHAILIGNARVRINRLTLKPGESSRLHRHPMHGLGIVLYDSRIEITSPGMPPRVLEPRAGDFAWQNAGTIHTIRNLGSTVFEVIDIELK